MIDMNVMPFGPGHYQVNMKMHTENGSEHRIDGIFSEKEVFDLCKSFKLLKRRIIYWKKSG